MLRILLADDHEIVRRGLKELLEEQPGWRVCGEARTGREAVDLAAELKPRVAVLDLAMPELNGLEATRRIRQAQPQTEVLVFTMHESDELIRQVLASGARGYIPKSDAAQHIVPAVKALSEGKPFLVGRVSELVLSGFLKGGHALAAAPVATQLTSREREIVQLLAEGNGNKQIAKLLDISIKTVETHRAAIMRKLKINSLPALVRFAIRSQIIEP